MRFNGCHLFETSTPGLFFTRRDGSLYIKYRDILHPLHLLLSAAPTLGASLDFDISKIEMFSRKVRSKNASLVSSFCFPPRNYLYWDTSNGVQCSDG